MNKLKANSRKEDIMETLEFYKTQLDRQGYLVAGLFLQGSQNYGMDQEGDTLNAYAVIFPGAESFAFDLPMTAKEKMPDGEITVKDIRLFATELLEGHYNVLELLLTPYRIVEWRYFKALLNTRLCEQVLVYNMPNTVASMLHASSEEKKKIREYAPKKQLKSLASIMHLHQMAKTLIGYAKEYDGSKHLSSISNNFYHIFYDGELMDGARALAAASQKPADEYGLEKLMSAMESRDKEILHAYGEWATQREYLPPEGMEKEQAETKQKVADWVESAFSLFWTR